MPWTKLGGGNGASSGMASDGTAMDSQNRLPNKNCLDSVAILGFLP